MKRVLIVGGANGIGLAIASELINSPTCEKVYIIDRSVIANTLVSDKVESFQFDLTNDDYSIFNRFTDIDSLIITAGFGKLSLFENVDESYIISSIKVNTLAVMRIIHHFYDKIHGKEDFYCAVMVSIAGFMSSPFFAVYGASKAALKVFIESLNVELMKGGTTNRILNVSPGSIKGTSFNNGKTDLLQLRDLACEILLHIRSKDDLFIPLYDEIFHNVLERYHNDFRAEGLHSYEYKENRLCDESLK